MMVRVGAQTAQAAGHFGGSCFHGGIGRVTQNADASIDGDGTCSPSVLSIPAEPAVRIVVMEVGGVEQRHQDIYVKEGDAHDSSRNLFTIRRSGFGAPAFGTKSKAPLRTFRGALAASDCRASSDLRAMLTTRLATCSRSADRVSVRRPSARRAKPHYAPSGAPWPRAIAGPVPI